MRHKDNSRTTGVSKKSELRETHIDTRLTASVKDSFEKEKVFYASAEDNTHFVCLYVCLFVDLFDEQHSHQFVSTGRSSGVIK